MTEIITVTDKWQGYLCVTMDFYQLLKIICYAKHISYLTKIHFVWFN